MMHKIKQVPEDFVVKEKSSVNFGKEGEYSYFLMGKRDYTTVKAIETIAKSAHAKSKDLGFAGSKDRRAITEQVISFRGSEKRLEGLKLNDIELKFLGKGSKPVSLGDLEGNNFEIVVRNITDSPKPINKITNFFGEQRFSRQNVDVGRAIVKGDFKKACELAELSAEGNDYVGALRKLNKKILQIYVHAYQSFIWNDAVKEYLKEKKDEKNEKIPIPGFGTELEGRIGEIIEAIMEKEGITDRDFIIRKIPEISAEGTERDMFIEVKDLEIGNLEDDELNNGKKKSRIKFFLQKGSYATEFIRQVF